MNAAQDLLPVQTLLAHTTVLVTLDTWGTERIAVCLKVRLFTIPLHHIKWKLLIASNTLQLLEDSSYIFPIKPMRPSFSREMGWGEGEGCGKWHYRTIFPH